MKICALNIENEYCVSIISTKNSKENIENLESLLKIIDEYDKIVCDCLFKALFGYKTFIKLLEDRVSDFRDKFICSVSSFYSGRDGVICERNNTNTFINYKNNSEYIDSLIIGKRKYFSNIAILLLLDFELLVNTIKFDRDLINKLNNYRVYAKCNSDKLLELRIQQLLDYGLKLDIMNSREGLMDVRTNLDILIDCGILKGYRVDIDMYKIQDIHNKLFKHYLQEKEIQFEGGFSDYLVICSENEFGNLIEYMYNINEKDVCTMLNDLYNIINNIKNMLGSRNIMIENISSNRLVIFVDYTIDKDVALAVIKSSLDSCIGEAEYNIKIRRCV